LALSVESSLQQGIGLNNIPFYILLFSATIVYYTFAYMGEISFSALSGNKKKLSKLPAPAYPNKRTDWYARNHKHLNTTQIIFLLLSSICAVYLAIIEYKHIFSLYLSEWLVLLSVPTVALLYYGNAFFPVFKINLRKTGWLKPFVIGFVWAGTVTLYPPMFHQWQQDLHYIFSPFVFWLLVKNWMFISVLCIMFDIKDYADDANRELQTFVVRVGLRKTIFMILLPLTAIGLAALWIYALGRDFSMMRILVNTIPFVLLLWVAYSMHRRKSILYYLIIIDGLMLAKGICGIAGALFFSNRF
jgi:hypothetical protein